MEIPVKDNVTNFKATTIEAKRFIRHRVYFKLIQRIGTSVEFLVEWTGLNATKNTWISEQDRIPNFTALKVLQISYVRKSFWMGIILEKNTRNERTKIQYSQ